MKTKPNMGLSKLTIQEVSFHRNGIAGAPFHAVLFTDANDLERGERPRKMLGIVFDAPEHCAVIQLNQPGEMTVRFGKNSWRGDHYEAELRHAIATQQSSGSVRVGPFAIPVEN